MTITTEEKNWLLINEVMITNILNKRISDLKDEILEVPEDKREQWIYWLKEYKSALGMLKEILKDNSPEQFTGI